jgi:hypothetical protein
VEFVENCYGYFQYLLCKIPCEIPMEFSSPTPELGTASGANNPWEDATWNDVAIIADASLALAVEGKNIWRSQKAGGAGADWFPVLTAITVPSPSTLNLISVI